MAEDRDELLALGAAGALTPDEMVELDRLLAADPQAAAEYAALVDDLTVLAESVAEPPPAGLRAAILATVAAEAQVGTAAPSVDAESATEHVAPVVPIHRRRWWMPATAVAAAIVIIGGALVVTRDADAPTEVVMADVLEADDAVAVELTGSAGALRLVKSDEVDATVIYGDDIDVPDEAQVLQLWAIEEEQPASMGTFVPTDNGHVEVVMAGTEPDGVLYAVTIEPEGGSEQPTSEPVLGPA